MRSAASGQADPRFRAVVDAFEDNLAEGAAGPRGDLGASFAAWADGRLVVDLWGGFEDAARTRPWRRDALVNVWSVTKAWAAAVAARLVEQGALDIEAPIARVWPAFAAEGKADVTLGELLSHTAGVPGVSAPVTIDDFYAHAPYVDAIAAAPPLLPRGAVCYHAMSYGHLLDAVIRRATDRRLAEHFAEDWTRPADLSLFLGLPATEDHRAVEIDLGPGMRAQREVETASPLGRAIRNPWFDADIPNQRPWRAAEIPAGNGQADAASLARFMASLIDPAGSTLAPATLADATRERMRGRDAAWDWEMRYGAGFQLNLDGVFGPNPGAFGHGGMGGALAFADPAANVAVGYAPNRLLLSEDAAPRRDRLLSALYAAL